jgi:antitoxin component of RelBE/YafQ-DinJ toxin-antitoxin module
MTNDSVVRARIDERTKKEAAAVLGAMGLAAHALPFLRGLFQNDGRLRQ